MALYTKSSGEQIETNDMAQPYLERALNKAIETDNQENIAVLQAEVELRVQQSQ